MNNAKKYKMMYYLSLFITFIFIIIVGIKMDEVAIFMMSTLFIINLILVLLFILLGKKYKLKNQNNIVPIVYLIFLFSVMLLAFLINSLLIVSNVHFMYYYNFVLVGYIMVNIYSLLCLSK